MSIFSTIGKAVSSAYNAVKNTVGSAFNYVTGRSQTASANSAPIWGSMEYNRQNAAQGIQPLYGPTGSTGKMSFGASGSWGAPVSKAPKSVSSGTKLSFGPTGYAAGSYALPQTFSSGSSGSSASYSTDYSGMTSALTSFASSMPRSTTISSSQLGAGTSSVATPSSPSPVNYTGQVIAGNVGVGADQKGTFQPIPTTEGQQETETPSQKAFKDYVASLKQPESEAELYNRAQRESGLQEARQRVQNTQAQIGAITAKMNSDLLQLRGTAAKEGVVEAVYGGQQAQVTREATIRLLPLQAQLAADQGNLEMAQENTTTLFKIYADDAKRSADFYNENVKAAYDLFTKDEKQRVDEILWQKNFNADMVKREADNQNSLAQQMLKDGNMAGYRAVTAIQIPHNVNSPTFAEDYQSYKQELANTASRFGVQAVTASEETPTQGASYREETAVRTLANVDALKEKATANKGIFGRTAALPIPDYLRSNAYRDFKAQLETLKSNIAFGELTAMREASKTGGALGQVSDKENKLLENALGALDMTQSPDNFISQLDKIKTIINRWSEAVGQNTSQTSGGSTSQPQQFRLPDGTTVTLQADGTYK